MNEPTAKEEWWRGFRAALNLPDSTPRQEAMRIKCLLVGSRELSEMLAEEAKAQATAITETLRKRPQP